jgi:flagellar motor switch protein FliM
VSLRDLMALQVGDVVIFDKDTTEPLVASVNGIPKFEVFAGTHKDHMVVQVADLITEAEE